MAAELTLDFDKAKNGAKQLTRSSRMTRETLGSKKKSLL
jgi:hypothetical protein